MVTKIFLFMSTYSLPITYWVYMFSHNLFSLLIFLIPNMWVYLALRELQKLQPDDIGDVEVEDRELTRPTTALLLSVLLSLPHVPVYITVPVLILLFFIYDENELLISNPYLWLKYGAYTIRVRGVRRYALLENDNEFVMPRVKLYNFYRINNVIIGVKKHEVK